MHWNLVWCRNFKLNETSLKCEAQNELGGTECTNKNAHFNFNRFSIHATYTVIWREEVNLLVVDVLFFSRYFLVIFLIHWANPICRLCQSRNSIVTKKTLNFHWILNEIISLERAIKMCLILKSILTLGRWKSEKKCCSRIIWWQQIEKKRIMYSVHILCAI